MTSTTNSPTRLTLAAPLTVVAPPALTLHGPTALQQLQACFPLPRPLTLLQCGIGVDSLGLLTRLYGLDGRPPLDPALRPDVVLHEDTGVEMPYTVDQRAELRWHCEQLGVPFIVIELDDPCRPPSKRRSLDAAYMAQRSRATGEPHPGIPTRNRRSCTFSWKIQPVRNLLSAFYDLRRGQWAKRGERHRVILGIAADEPDRCGGRTSYVAPAARHIEILYPMVAHGLDRAGARAAIAAAGWEDPGKSGCFCCPFQPVANYWALSQLWPELFARCVRMEQAARAWNPKLTLTRGPLEEEVARWAARHRPLPDPQAVLREGYELRRKW